MSDLAAPFPLEGGRAGDGGDTAPSKPTNPKITRARRLRRESTLAERLLWAEFRKLKLNVRRQVPIGRFVADFAHHESRLIVEIDGYHHTLPGRAEEDAARTAWLNAAGYRVVRFDEAVVRADAAAVAERVLAETVSPPTPTLPPSRGKGVRFKGSTI